MSVCGKCTWVWCCMCVSVYVSRKINVYQRYFSTVFGLSNPGLLVQCVRRECHNIYVCACVRSWLCVCVCVLFYVALNNISVISWRWLLVSWDAITLIYRVTDTRHKYTPLTLSWHRANHSWFYPLNAERLVKKQSVQFHDFVMAQPGSNQRPPDYLANALTTRPPSWSKNLNSPVNVTLMCEHNHIIGRM